jgi:hypothetical protein
LLSNTYKLNSFPCGRKFLHFDLTIYLKTM